jgi:hypothetical protein
MMAIPLAALALVAALVCAALAYRAFRQHLNARAIAIRTRSGIDEALFVRIGGIDQWVQIRSEDRANPVVLVLQGRHGIVLHGVHAGLPAMGEIFHRR